MRPRVAEVSQELSVGAAGFFEGIGEDGQLLEGAVGVHGLGDGGDRGGEAGGVEVDRMEGVEDVAEHLALRNIFLRKSGSGSIVTNHDQSPPTIKSIVFVEDLQPPAANRAMKDSRVAPAEGDRDRLAIGYGRRLPEGPRERRPFTDARGITAAGGLSSTVEDLARFVSLQFREDSPVLKGSTLQEMHRVQWLMPDWKSGRGLGFHIVHRDDGDLVGHGGWVAGYQTAVYFRPKDRIGVIVLTNADDGLPYPGAPDSVVDRAFKWVGPALAKAAMPVKEEKARPEWQKYVGKYRSPWADAQVLVLSGKLVLINPTEQDPTGTQATLVPVGEHTFRIEDGSPSGPHGERVIFELKDEKVVRVKIGENFSMPVK